MKTVIIIPARWGSTRFPQKPLAMLQGADGKEKSLIQRCFDVATKVKDIDGIFIATDHEKIAEHVKSFGAEVIMTSEACENGSERVLEAAQKLALKDDDIVINLQGDAPLTPPYFIEQLIEELKQDNDAHLCTPAISCDEKTLQMFLEDRKNDKVGGTTVVFDNNNYALYFSKEVLPYMSHSDRQKNYRNVYHHVGLYAYKMHALKEYKSWKATNLENFEGLEQLRFLQNGKKVKIAIAEIEKGMVFWEVNNPEDVKRVSSALKSANIS